MSPVRMTRADRRRAEREAEKHARTNGVYHVPIPQPPMIAGAPPRTEVWVPLAEEYPGWMFLMWRNHPREVRMALFTANTEEARIATFQELVRAHNGWTNHKGEEYPPPTEAAFWRAIPDEVFSAMYHRLRDEAVLALPNSLSGTSTSSGPTTESETAEPTPPASESPGDTSSSETSPKSGESEASSD